jgi:integrase/recombinase XerD
MKTYNPENERTKRDYFAFLKEAKGLSEPSIDAAAKAIATFEIYTRYKSFRAFHFEQAAGFKRCLAAQLAKRSGEPLSKATLRQTLGALKAFVEWLSGQTGFRSRITYSDAAYFNLSLKDATVARATREERIPTLEQIHHVLDSMPYETDIERRDRALFALAALTAARANALASMRMKHIDLDAGRIIQDAKQVRTKFSKSFPTYFVPIGGNALAIVQEWVLFLQRERLWGLDDPLFPAARVEPGADRRFNAIGLDRKGWRNAAPVRKVFREAFEAAGLPYSNPHTFRKTLARLGQTICRTAEELKAWSQNLGHDDVLTTFTSYGTVSLDRQAEIIRGARSRTHAPDDLTALFAVVDRLKGTGPTAGGC